MKSRDFLTQVLVKAVRRTPLGRGSARKLILQVIERIHPGPIQSAFREVPFLFHFDNTTERKALISDSYDRAELDFLKAFLGAQPATFIDIGANSGLYSIFLAAHMPPESRVIAVEPNPAMCRRIELNASLLRARGLAKNVTISIEAAALGALKGELYLDLSRGLGPAQLTDDKSKNALAVPVKTLPGLCREKGIERIDAIKIDVEGYEDRVLMPLLSAGAPQLLPRALVFETVHRRDWHEDAISAAIRAGYQNAGTTRSSILMTHGR
jgi:FkbM family methyltransferase